MTSRLSSSSGIASWPCSGRRLLCLGAACLYTPGARPCSSGPTSVCQLNVPGGRTSGMSSPLPSRRVRHGTKPYVYMARMADRQNGM